MLAQPSQTPPSFQSNLLNEDAPLKLFPLRPVDRIADLDHPFVCNSRTADKFVIRLPPGMREAVREQAKHHYRSMNSEILFRLKTFERLNEENAGLLRQVQLLTSLLSARIDLPELPKRKSSLDN